MSFFPSPTKRYIPAEGSTKATIAVIGEAPGAIEEKLSRPFVGPAGSVLDQCCHSAGVLRHNIYITNVVKERPAGNNIEPYFDEQRMRFTEQGRACVEELIDELNKTEANILVPAGNTALAAICGEAPPWRINRIRGYVVEPRPELSCAKAIPIIHPASVLYGGGFKKKSGDRTSPYIQRYYITNDIKKAKAEAEYPELRRPTRDLLIPSDIKNALDWLDYFNKCPRLSVDIEVVNFEISAIALADSPEQGMSFPFYHNIFDEHEETALWRAIAKPLGNKKIVKVFQNGIFDIHMLATRAGVIVEGVIEDTMIAHSVMFPEMLKSLEFLGSMYCGAQEYWKNLVKFDNIKDNS
jgi:DNA polymerase